VVRPLHWNHTIGPLAEFCKAPHFRAEKMSIRLSLEEQGARLARTESELRQTQSQLDTLRGKRWVRWGIALTSSRAWLRIPMTILAALIGLLLIPIFWIADIWPARNRSKNRIK